MNYYGEVKLIYNGQEIDNRKYYSKEHRQKIFDGWKILYNKQYRLCVIHICPVVIDINNIMGKIKRTAKEEQTVKQFTRPPAVYTNIKSNHYHYS